MSTAEEFHEEQTVGKVYDSRLFRRLLGYMRPYRAMAAVAVVLLILSSFLQLVGPLVTAIAVDLFIQPLDRPEKVTPVSAWVARWLAESGYQIDAVTGIQISAVVFFLSLVLAFLVLYGQGYVMEIMGQRIMFDLRRDVFAHLQRLHIAYFDRHPIGRLVTRATADIGALNELFTSGLVSIFGDVFLLAGIVTVLFVFDWRLAFASFAILPMLLGLTLWFKSRARRSYRDMRVRLARINAFVQEHILGMAVVQLFGREQRAYREFSEINDRYRQANIAAIFYYAIYFPMVALITSVGLALIVWYGGGRVLEGMLSVGALIAFLQYAQRFYQPISDLSEKYNILQSAMAAAERIFELLDSGVDIRSPADPHRPSRVHGAIELEGVDFSYLPGEPVLEDVSFRIEPGEMVAVVGHTGAGKSTLASLLLRFYDVDRGRVTIDGVDVRQWHLGELRRAIAMVLQDVVLFSGDVASNIRLGNDQIDEEKLIWAARETGALEFIERLPGGFSQPVRERGEGLSVGQKQLISFARALAFDPRILILDEATASIDTETEQHIQQALERLLVGRTSLVIAHRLSTIQRADRILVMHKGRLREQGTHQELLAQGGIYQKLYLLQYQEEESLVS